MMTPADARATETPERPLLAVEDLHRYFAISAGIFNRKVGDVRAVDGVSFAAYRGETLGVVGESGCGKSTLARLLMGLIPVQSGRIVFNGQTVGGQKGGGAERLSLRLLRRQLQIVFQDSGASLNPRLPIEESIAYGPRAHGTKREAAVKIAHELLQRVGLRPDLFGPRYPHELSGGQKQRVNIARALALNPCMLILDEAVSALDKSVEAQVLNLLQYLKREFDLTYVFISHDLNVVQYIADRVMVMYLGQVIEMGPADAIYCNAQHPYTRALLESRLALDPDQRMDSAPLTGDPPNPIAPPSGCRFRTRCAFAQEVCERKAPVLPVLADRTAHVAACHRSDPHSGYDSAVAPFLLAAQACAPQELSR
jgi:peptide/nickel transport system ATP-binding protein